MFYLLAALAFVLIFIGYIRLKYFVQELAHRDILFTTVKEGTAKAIMRGHSFERFVMSFAGYHLNIPGTFGYRAEVKGEKASDWQVLYHGQGNKSGFSGKEMLDESYDTRSSFEKEYGVYWIGWPWSHSIYVYEFEWNETRTNRTTGEEEIFPRAEPADFIFVADFVYAVKTVGAETKDRLPTDLLTLVTIAVRNPYRALFSGEDWMRRVTSAINSHVRGFVGSANYQELIAKKGELGNATASGSDLGGTESDLYWYENFSKPIIGLTGQLPGESRTEHLRGLKGRYGVEIRTADLQTMELSGSGKTTYLEATTKAYVAAQQAEATRLDGEAAAKVIRMRGEADADVILAKGMKEAEALAARLKIIKEHGSEGLALAQFDAMQEASKGAGNTVIWANNPLIGVAQEAAKAASNIILPPNTKKGGS